MPGLISNVDPEGLLEYSVVFTDRAVNQMSMKFRGVPKEISRILNKAYNGRATAIVLGSGTFGMESVARQFGTGKKCLVIRNGWFSYRWSQIFEMGRIPSEEIVMKARKTGTDAQAPWIPAPIDEVVAAIQKSRPDVVFAPHVETASGMILPPDYLRTVADAVHAAGGLFVLDCIASGAIWVDMEKAGVDVLITAPQKGWSSPASCAMIVFSQEAIERLAATNNTSFAMDLKKWRQVMETFEAGNHMYHATMPTDALIRLLDNMLETERLGFENLKARQQEQGDKVRAALESNKFPSVAAKGFQAPGVVVSYTTDPDVQSGKKFAALGLQTAAGVPLQCDEGPDFKSFRIGLFGLDKLMNVDRTVESLSNALKAL
jgi:aspartate aminotransferase-like enzyme